MAELMDGATACVGQIANKAGEYACDCSYYTMLYRLAPDLYRFFAGRPGSIGRGAAPVVRRRPGTVDGGLVSRTRAVARGDHAWTSRPAIGANGAIELRVSTTSFARFATICQSIAAWLVTIRTQSASVTAVSVSGTLSRSARS